MSRVQIPFAVETKYTLTSAAGGLASGTVVTGPVSGASVSVTLRSDGTPATVYAAETGSGTLSGGALVTDAAGNVPGWLAADVQYNITIGSIGAFTGAGPIGFDAVSGLGFPADQAANVGSPRTLGTGALQAMAGNDQRVTSLTNLPVNVKAPLWGPDPIAGTFGAIGDGNSHPLSGYFATLSAAQAVYPFALALTDELDWAAIQKALNSRPTNAPNIATGIRVYVPFGQYILSRTLNVDDSSSVTIVGDGGLTPGNGLAPALGSPGRPSTSLLWTGSNGVSCISARSSIGFQLRDLLVASAYSGFAGTIVDLRHSASGGDTSQWNFQRCCITHQGSGTPASLVNLASSNTGVFDHCQIVGHATYGVEGQPAGGYANNVTFESCSFCGTVNAPIHNVGNAWVFVSPTVEPNASSAAAFIKQDAGNPAYSLTVDGGWMGDTNNTGTWIDLGTNNAGGIEIHGAFMLSCAKAISAPGAIGLSITGNTFEQIATMALDIAGASNVLEFNNVYGVGVTAVMPAGVYGQSVIQRYDNWLAPTFAGTWSNTGAPWQVAGYKKTPDGRVQLRGRIQQSTPAGATTALTLPAGFRPAGTETFVCSTFGSTTQVDVTATGGVNVTGASGYVSLAGVSFEPAT